ncbi:MAG: type II toxin-antitoxin system RelE/ParE family toxin [Bryobacterales bacterium]|nr:type II toxin-antitoxin system RelE/ParE family toxin [Bryobacterales bacterium]
MERRSFDLTPEARDDLVAIILGIAEDSPRIAERIRVQLLEELRRLARNPGFGHYREDLLSRRYRFWGFYRYVIVYAWQTKPVRIIAVLHGARDLGALLGTRG